MSLMMQPGHIPEWTTGDRLRKARESAGFGQKEFAEHTSMARATISAAENGHRVPSRANVKLWALATGVPFEWLLTGEAPHDGGAPDPSHLRESNPRPIHYMRQSSAAVIQKVA